MSRTAPPSRRARASWYAGAVVRGHRRLHGVEPDQHDAGLLARLVGLLGEAAGHDGPAGGLQRRPATAAYAASLASSVISRYTLTQ